MFYSEKKIDRLKRIYPHGTKICCDSMDDDLAPVESGTIGKVDFVDDSVQIHVDWQNGRTLALIPGVDSFHIVREPSDNAEEVEEQDDMSMQTV